MGIYARKLKDGSTVWYTRHTYIGSDGKRHERRKSFGKHKLAAQRADKKRAVQALEGEIPGQPAGAKLPFSDLMDQYLEHSAVTKRPNTHKLDQYVARHLLEEFRSAPLHTITPAAAHRYLEGKLKDFSPSTVHYHLAVLKHVFAQAVKWELLRTNPLGPEETSCNFRVTFL